MTLLEVNEPGQNLALKEASTLGQMVLEKIDLGSHQDSAFHLVLKANFLMSTMIEQGTQGT